MHADSVSKSLRQNFCFFARAAIVSAGENIIFRDNNGYKQRLGSLVPKRRTGTGTGKKKIRQKYDLLVTRDQVYDVMSDLDSEGLAARGGVQWS